MPLLHSNVFLMMQSGMRKRGMVISDIDNPGGLRALNTQSDVLSLYQDEVTPYNILACTLSVLNRPAIMFSIWSTPARVMAQSAVSTCASTRRPATL